MIHWLLCAYHVFFHTAVRKELAHRSQSAGLLWKHEMQEAKSQLEVQEESQKAVSSGIMGITLVIIYIIYIIC